MADIALILESKGGYQYGDIICAESDCRIRDVHAQHCCHITKCPFTIEGLNNKDSHAYERDSLMCEYHFIRRSRTEVERIRLVDNVSVVFSNVPKEVDGHTQRIHLENWLNQRVKHRLHRIETL